MRHRYKTPGNVEMVLKCSCRGGACSCLPAPGLRHDAALDAQPAAADRYSKHHFAEERLRAQPYSTWTDDDHAALLAPDDHRHRRSAEEVAANLAPNMDMDTEHYNRSVAANLPPEVIEELERWQGSGARRSASYPDEIWTVEARRAAVEDELGPRKFRQVLDSVREAAEEGVPWRVAFGRRYQTGAVRERRPDATPIPYQKAGQRERYARSAHGGPSAEQQDALVSLITARWGCSREEAIAAIHGS